jgi:hypothetical protein
MQPEAAETPAEQRHRHGDEGKVVPDGRRVDARQRHFEDQTGQCDEKDAEMKQHERGSISCDA